PLATFLQGNGGVQPQPITGDQITMTFLTPFDKQWADFLLKVFIGRSLSQGNTCEKKVNSNLRVKHWHGESFPQFIKLAILLSLEMKHKQGGNGF
ncbi:MAG: hypothetical protein DWI28_03740, partial [Planctomycetota bacterium]